LYLNITQIRIINTSKDRFITKIWWTCFYFGTKSYIRDTDIHSYAFVYFLRFVRQFQTLRFPPGFTKVSFNMSHYGWPMCFYDIANQNISFMSCCMLCWMSCQNVISSSFGEVMTDVISDVMAEVIMLDVMSISS
jgi:hypothetical protein